MIESYKRFWENILDFSGTSDRPDYWWPTIINWILGIVIINIIQSITGHSVNYGGNFLGMSINVVSFIVTAIVWIATLSLQFRRLHDSDHSAGWILIQLIPLIGTIWFVILMLLPTRRNRWS